MKKHSKNRDRFRSNTPAISATDHDPTAHSIGDNMDDDSDSHGPSTGVRQERLEHQIEQALEWLFRDEIRDPMLENVRVVRVELSVDYRAVRVYWTLIEGHFTKPLEAAMERVVPFVRASLGESLGIKRVPLVRFFFEPGGAQ